MSALQPIVAREPYHVTASYVLGLALTRSGKAEEGQQLLQRAQDLRRVSYAVTFGTGYLEQGRYAEAIASTGAEPELVDQQTPPAKFTASPIVASPLALAGAGDSPFGRRFAAADLSDAGARALATALGGGETLVDVDGDGTLELVVAGGGVQRLFRRDASGAWSDATSRIGPGVGAGEQRRHRRRQRRLRQRRRARSVRAAIDFEQPLQERRQGAFHRRHAKRQTAALPGASRRSSICRR